MLTTIGLVINAMAFGGAMARTGLLARLVEAALSRVKSAGGLIAATVGSCIGTNILGRRSIFINRSSRSNVCRTL